MKHLALLLCLALAGIEAWSYECVEPLPSLEEEVADFFERADVVVLGKAASSTERDPKEVLISRVWKGRPKSTVHVHSEWMGMPIGKEFVLFAEGPRARGEYWRFTACVWAEPEDVIAIVNAYYGEGTPPTNSNEQDWIATAWLLIAILVSTAGLWLWQLVRPTSTD